MKTAYIAGKITGECENIQLLMKCRQKFKDAEKQIKSSGDYICFYGLKINEGLINSGGASWSTYMKNDIKTLIECDVVFVLPDWKTSRGANIEVNLAIDLGIKVVFLS